MKAEQLPKAVVEYVFFLCPDFPLIPLSGAIEVLDTANKVLGYTYYSWNLHLMMEMKLLRQMAFQHRLMFPWRT